MFGFNCFVSGLYMTTFRYMFLAVPILTGIEIWSILKHVASVKNSFLTLSYYKTVWILN